MPKASAPTPAPDAPLPVEYAVRIYPVKGSKYTLANANVDINGIFAIRGVKIMNGENGPFVAMPQYKDGHGDYHDICFPCTAEARQMHGVRRLHRPSDGRMHQGLSWRQVGNHLRWRIPCRRIRLSVGV